MKLKDPALKSLVYKKYNYDSKSEEILPKNHLFKYILRCLTSCMRNQRIVLGFVCDNEENIEVILKIIKNVRDEEILANANKILRIILRDDFKIHDLLIENKKNMRENYNSPRVFLSMDENTLAGIIN